MGAAQRGENRPDILRIRPYREWGLLFFLNSDLATRAADALAGRVLAKPDIDDAARVRLLFELAYARPPTAKEVERVTAGVVVFEKEFAGEPDANKRRRKAWAAVCQTVLASNEFIHLR